MIYGTLVKRPSKHIKSPYVGDVEVSQTQGLAHCPALGLGNILVPGSRVMMYENKTGKTDYTIQAVMDDGTWVGNIPLDANRFVKRMLEDDPEIKYVKPEYNMGTSRIDFYTEDTDGTPTYIEVKSVHIKRKNTAIFPVGYVKKKGCTVSERANKHLKHMEMLATQGKRAKVIFVIQRDDVDSFSPNEEDREFTSCLGSAMRAGVSVKLVFCSMSERGLTLLRLVDYLE